MPPQVLSCLVLYAFILGFVQETHKAHIWIPLGIVLWTGFDGMLRPGEFCALRVKDLLLPSNQLMSFCDSLVDTHDYSKVPNPFPPHVEAFAFDKFEADPSFAEGRESYSTLLARRKY